MLSFLTKKKISEDKLANVIVNSLCNTVDEGFSDIAGLINDDPTFVTKPNILDHGSDKFLVIVVCANLKMLNKHFDAEQENRIKFKIIEKFSVVFGMEEEKFYSYIKDYSSLMSKLNHPSKNVLYSMSKAVYNKYQLNCHQEEYFKEMKTPNPILLKRLDELMENFIWDWEKFFNKYKVTD